MSQPRQWEYLHSARVHCVDCILTGQFEAGWVYLLGFLGATEILVDDANNQVIEIEIPPELRRLGLVPPHFV